MQGNDLIKNMKIRNPELIDKEIKDIYSSCPDDLLKIAIFCSILQFWRWVKLDSEAKLSDVLKMSVSTEEFIKKGYPEDDVMEFMKKKVEGLEKKKGAEVELK